jgi:hypothetical protein
MPVLKSLAFVAVPRIAGNPTLIRRARLVARLEEQKSLIQDPTRNARRSLCLARNTARMAEARRERKPAQIRIGQT